MQNTKRANHFERVGLFEVVETEKVRGWGKAGWFLEGFYTLSRYDFSCRACLRDLMEGDDLGKSSMSSPVEVSVFDTPDDLTITLFFNASHASRPSFSNDSPTPRQGTHGKDSLLRRGEPICPLSSDPPRLTAAIHIASLSISATCQSHSFDLTPPLPIFFSYGRSRSLTRMELQEKGT